MLHQFYSSAHLTDLGKVCTQNTEKYAKLWSSKNALGSGYYYSDYCAQHDILKITWIVLYIIKLMSIVFLSANYIVMNES